MNTKTAQQIKALVYCRVSSERQKNEGHGLDSQEHRCREYSKSKGYDVEVVFKDSFTGGGDFTKRPAMVELFTYIDSYPYKRYVVIFDDISRLARDVSEHIKLRAAFRVRNVIPLCLNYNFDETPEGEFTEVIMAANAELFRKQNRRQVIQKQRARLESGYWPFNPVPGYTHKKDPIHGKLLTPDYKAEIVKEAFEGFASYRFRDQVSVQKFLMDKNFCGAGRYISLTTVKRLLTRVIYAGYIEYAPWEVPRRLGHHEAIISLELFQSVQDRLNGKPRSFTRKDTRPDFPLRGPVLCSGCGKPLTASWSKGRNKKHPYYRCNQNGCPFKNKSIPKDVIENRFKNILVRVRPKREVIDYTKAIFVECWKDRIAKILAISKTKESELADLLSQKEAIIKRIPKASEIVAQEYEKQVEALAQKEQLLKEEITNPKVRGIDFETALDTTLDYIENPIKKWESDSLNDKRLVLKLVFTDRLVYDREKGFETANYSLPIKAFELLATSNSQGVEMGGLNRRPEFC